MGKYLDYNGLIHLWSKIKDRIFPAGGTTGQVLAKASNSDYDAVWVTPSGGGADYITDEGTSGIWKYRKWNSGRSECWGSISQNVNGWGSWGSLYESNQMFQATYPSSLFVETPELFAAPFGALGLAGVEFYQGASSTQTPQMYLLRGNSISGTYACKVNCYAIGRWK